MQTSIVSQTKLMTMQFLETILKNFPNAVEGKKLTVDIVDYLARKYGLTPKNTLFGFSTCPDEINRTVTQFKSYYGEKQFPLGGLTGYPFRGKTGFVAFSHHAPTNGTEGNLVILYGPHVGINLDGDLGKVLRENQSHESTACGASIAFLNNYQKAKRNRKMYEPKEDPFDMEQHAIEKMLMPYADKILAAENPIKELVEVNYSLIENAVLEIIKELKHHFKGRIVLVGGIMINTPQGQSSYFDLRRFEMYHNGNIENLKLKL